MKRLTWIILFLSCIAKGQGVNYDEIILPQNKPTDDFAEKLVRLAWINDPESEIARRNVTLAEYDVKLAGVDWLNIISFQGNLNEFNINPTRDVNNRSQFFPRYNVGARITMGMLFTIPINTKKSKEQWSVAEAMLNDQKLALRSNVLQLYNNYLMMEKIYKVQSELAMSAESAHQVGEDKFKEGSISFEEYATTKSSYNQAQVTFYQAEAAYKNAKILLEEVIGVKLEDVR